MPLYRPKVRVPGRKRHSSTHYTPAMPLYQYEVILPDGEEGMAFEVMQKITDPPLTEHPTLKLPVRRVISAPAIGGNWSSARVANNMSDAGLASKGFTKYVKTGDGTYERSAGTGGPKKLGGK